MDTLVGAGLFGGAAHILTGADHIAVLLPIAVGRRTTPAAAAAGARWGGGHALGVILLGVVLYALQLVAPRPAAWLHTDASAAIAEGIVGLTLLYVGISGLLFSHAFASETSSALAARPRPAEHERSALLGFLHGVTGIDHVVGILPGLLAASFAHLVAFVLAFAVGTVLATAAATAFFGATTSRLAKISSKFPQIILLVSSLASIALAFALLTPACQAGLAADPQLHFASLGLSPALFSF